jgi:hypothetical protein
MFTCLLDQTRFSHVSGPLGNPPPHSVKYYNASELLELVKDRAWLVKVTNAVNQHWQKKNASKKNHPVDSLQNGCVMASGGGRNGRDNSSSRDR